MKRPKYQKYFLPESIGWYCSLACCMWVMNYFWYTAFNRQNTWEIMQLMKAGNYSWVELLDLPEITYRLSLLWFNVSYFSSYPEGKYIDFIKNPLNHIHNMIDPKYHQFIEDWYRRVPGEWVEISLTDTKFESRILENKLITKIYDANIIDEIKKHQWEWVLFMVWLSYYLLHNEELPEWSSGWHVLLVSHITENNKVVIFDPGPPVLHYYEVDIERFLLSVKEMWEYSFIKISSNESC